MILFFDTETTGLYRFKEEPTSPTQPHLVQLACIGTDEAGAELFEYNQLVCPVDYEIPPNMIHGISQEQALTHGISGHEVAVSFNGFISAATKLVCHNYGFDSRIMQTHLMRHSLPADKLHQDKDYCTMMASTNYCKLKGKNPRGWKWPKLSEAFEYFFPGESANFESNAHDALFDVRATKRIYFELMKREGVSV